MNRKLQILCLGAAILSTLVLAGKALLPWLLTKSFDGIAHSVGVIGGADGPTAVFITTGISHGSFPGSIIWFVVLIVSVLGFICLRRKKHKEADK